MCRRGRPPLPPASASSLPPIPTVRHSPSSKTRCHLTSIPIFRCCRPYPINRSRRRCRKGDSFRPFSRHMNPAPDDRLLGEYQLKQLIDENSLSRIWLAEQV